MAVRAPRTLTIVASKVCDLTGAKRNKANRVVFSGKRNRKWQNVNVQDTHVYWPEGQRTVRMRLSAKALRSIDKKGLDTMAREAGIDLWKLPFRDCGAGRVEWLKARGAVVPTPKHGTVGGNLGSAARPKSQAGALDRRMKNPEKLAASKRKPVLSKYKEGRVVFYKEGATLN